MTRFTLTITLILLGGSLIVAQQKPLTIVDMMKFRQIKSPTISNDGQWVAYELKPDRGDGSAIVQSVDGSRTFSFVRGTKPIISSHGRWAAMSIDPPAELLEKKEKEKEKPKAGMMLLNLVNGDTLSVQAVQKFQFAENGKWITYHLFKDDTKVDSAAKKEKDEKNLGSDLVVRNLSTWKADTIAFVVTFAIDSLSATLAYAVADTSGNENGLFFRSLGRENSVAQEIARDTNGIYTHLSWSAPGKVLAFVAAREEREKLPGPGTLWLWDGEAKTLSEAASSKSGEGWIIPSKNSVSWSGDGRRIFFGMRQEAKSDEKEKDTTKQIDLFDIDALLDKRGVDVWHWNDPFINSHQKKRWKDVKDQTFTVVYHMALKKTVRLGDEDLPTIVNSDNSSVVLGRSDVPYRKAMSWEGSHSDIYVVSLSDGGRKRVATKVDDNVSLSPNGKFVLYFDRGHWHLYSVESGITRNLTKDLSVSFADEENDLPALPGSYGFAGWVKGDEAALIYDRYDIWWMPTDGSDPSMITNGEGRKGAVRFRIEKTDRDARFFTSSERLLLTGYHDKKKTTGFYEASVGKPQVRLLVGGEKKFNFVLKAKQASKILYTRESYSEFPDIWIGSLDLSGAKKLSNANPQVKDFAWGTAELVGWQSLDGEPLQGVLIKPGGYKKGMRYPVLVYYYERFSQRLHEFNRIEVNHRPCFPYYASNGYAVFLPDVKFDLGRPGYSATKCIVPGVQKLIDMGVADPQAIGLHGHSWSGYQTAFVVTQTNMFAAAIAGAPVSNMTSAYSGIRWGTGLARQFQYEMQQSRIGGSLWEYPERYIENSPVFFADRINTPMLIQFGDEDEAVPWYQGIELYLAMRRLGKDCVFLQYRGEPHHLKQYPNKVDYTIKFKEYLDHYLKGAPAPEWLSKGVPYSEEN